MMYLRLSLGDVFCLVVVVGIVCYLLGLAKGSR